MAFTRTDSGSATLDFLAFGIPGVLTVVIALQLVYAAYLNTVAYDAASEAAAVAAYADGTDAGAESLASRVVGSLTGVHLDWVQVSHRGVGSVTASQVTVQLTAPILGFGSIPVRQSVESIDEPRS